MKLQVPVVPAIGEEQSACGVYCVCVRVRKVAAPYGLQIELMAVTLCHIVHIYLSTEPREFKGSSSHDAPNTHRCVVDRIAGDAGNRRAGRRRARVRPASGGDVYRRAIVASLHVICVCVICLFVWVGRGLWQAHTLRMPAQQLVPHSSPDAQPCLQRFAGARDLCHTVHAATHTHRGGNHHINNHGSFRVGARHRRNLVTPYVILDTAAGAAVGAQVVGGAGGGADHRRACKRARCCAACTWRVVG